MDFEPVIRHTAQLGPRELTELREFVFAAFGEHSHYHAGNWENALGGLHVTVRGEHGLLAHASVVQRQVGHRERTLRTGYVESVAVHPAARRRGLGDQVMAAIEQLIDDAYELGALSASTLGAPLYRARGWQLWSGEIWALSPQGPVRLPDEEDSTFVRESAGGPSLDPAHRLSFDWREGDVV